MGSKTKKHLRAVGVRFRQFWRRYGQFIIAVAILALFFMLLGLHMSHRASDKAAERLLSGFQIPQPLSDEQNQTKKLLDRETSLADEATADIFTDNNNFTYEEDITIEMDWHDIMPETIEDVQRKNKKQQHIDEELVETIQTPLPTIEDTQTTGVKAPDVKPVTPEISSRLVPEAQEVKNPRLAIVIDDLGIDRRRSREILEIAMPLTVAFLPYAARAESLWQMAHENGHEVWAHIPMEPRNLAEHNPGPGALYTSLTDDALAERLTTSLDKMKAANIRGINNHMGSRMTADTRAMSVVMRVLSDHNLAYLDSRTVANSVGAELARIHNVPTASRHIFLDHVDDVEIIMEQLRKAETLALRRSGGVITIGHPRDATLRALQEWSQTRDPRVEIVPVSRLLR